LAAEGDNPYSPPETELAPASARLARTGKLAWEEPASFIRAYERATQGRPNPWHALGRMLVITIVLFAVFRVSVWIRGQEHPQFGFWGMLAIAAGVGLTGAYLLPLIRSWSPAQIWIDGDGIGRQSIMRANALQIERWPWREIAACSLERLELGGRRFDALVLHFPTRSAYAIGLSRKVTPAQIEALVKSCDKEMRNHLS
jgi:hypothetical protein